MANEKPTHGDASSQGKVKIRSFENVKALTEALTRALTMTEPPKPAPCPTPTHPATGLNLNPPADVKPKEPKKLFFYGSLMDPDVLHAIARTSATDPELHKATIKGYKMKMWGCYPTLVPAGADDVVHGMYWQAENEGQLALLQRYETDRYEPAACAIHVDKDGSVIDDGLAFVWAGDAESGELKDGVFSLEEYRLYYKPVVFKRGT